MTSDYMDRPVELLLMDAYLTADIEHIAKMQDKAVALGVTNIARRTCATLEILVESAKRAARYVVYKAQACGYIDSYDGVAIRQMITHMGEEEFKTWN